MILSQLLHDGLGHVAILPQLERGLLLHGSLDPLTWLPQPTSIYGDQQSRFPARPRDLVQLLTCLLVRIVRRVLLQDHGQTSNLG